MLTFVSLTIDCKETRVEVERATFSLFQIL